MKAAMQGDVITDSAITFHVKILKKVVWVFKQTELKKNLLKKFRRTKQVKNPFGTVWCCW